MTEKEQLRILRSAMIFIKVTVADSDTAEGDRLHVISDIANEALAKIPKRKIEILNAVKEVDNDQD